MRPRPPTDDLALLVLPAALVLALAAAACSSPGQGASGNLPPLVTISQPTDGAVLGGAGPFAFAGEAVDPEQGALTGDALTWNSSIDGVLGGGTEISTPLGLGIHTITLYAVDAGGAAGQASITVTVVEDNQPPQAFIDAPADGSLHYAGQEVQLGGRGTDPEDGDVGASLAWSSDVDGALGTGPAVTATLSEGAHHITLTATDSAGLTGTAAIDITVAPPGVNQAPKAFIDTPAAGATFEEGDTVLLEGHGDDPEDGALPPGSLYWTSDLDGALGSGKSVTMLQPSLGDHQIVLTAVDSAGASGKATRTIHILPAGANHPPAVQITSPEDKAKLTVGESIAFVGSATDDEDGPLGGAALVWRSDLDGEIGTSAAFQRADLSAGVHTITLTATDSGGAEGSATVTITLNPAGNTAPEATISAPEAGEVFNAGEAITLVGNAADDEDGALTGDALSWSSNLDGALGTGSPLEVPGLSPGSHTIRLQATDSGGAVGVDQVAITVLAVNTAPEVSIDAPADGSTFVAGTEITFTGGATDAEDGQLTGAALTWRSDRDGPMGTGASLVFASLSAGEHTITLTAVDSGGKTGSASIGLTIEPAAVNLPPVAQLTGPELAFVGQPVLFDASGSYDPDGTITNYSFDFGDGSPGVSGSDPEAGYAFAAPGSFVVTVQVRDDDDATDSDQLGVTVEIPVRVPEVIEESDDSLGTACDLAVAADGSLHVIYRDNTHPSLWYATSADGESWESELVDGMGFDVGARVGSRMSLALDPDAVPHIAYTYDGSAGRELRYAVPSGSSWLLENADGGIAYYDWDVAVAVDPAKGYRPTIAYTTSNGLFGVAVSARTGPGSWVSAAEPGDGANNRVATGGLAIGTDGAAWITFQEAENTSWDGNDRHAVISWSAAGGFGSDDTLVEGYVSDSENARVALDASGEPAVVNDRGLEHLLGGVWTHSDLETFTISTFDLAFGPGGELWIGYGHSGKLELIHSLTGDYWARQYHGPMDATWIGVDVGTDGEAHACFFRDGNLLVY